MSKRKQPGDDLRLRSRVVELEQWQARAIADNNKIIELARRIAAIEGELFTRKIFPASAIFDLGDGCRSDGCRSEVKTE